MSVLVILFDKFHFTVYTILYFVLQPKPNPVYVDLAVIKQKSRPIPPAPEDTTVVYSKLMAKEQADTIRQQLEQKPPPYDDVEISSTSFQTNVIPPGIHGDRDVTTYKEEGTRVSINKVEEKPQNEEKTFENQSSVSHRIPTPEDNQNDIPPPPPGIRGDRDVTTFKEEGARVSINKVEEKLQNEEEAFENQSSVSHCIPPLEDYQNDIPPPVPACENSPRRTPPIPPPTPPPPPPPYHLSSSSQVSQSGNVPDIQ